MDGFLDDLTRTALAREPVSREAALRVLAGDDELLDVVAAGSRVRREFFGRRVKLNTIINLKSGMCPEDCGYCSQRLGSEAGVLKYSWVDPQEAAGIADRAVQAGAKRVCLVASGRGPGERDITRVERTIDAIKADQPGVEVCVCLGLLSDGQADRLRAANPRALPVRLPRRRGPARRWTRDPSAEPATVGAAPGELDLPG